jgi:hypothetical protein
MDEDALILIFKNSHVNATCSQGYLLVSSYKSRHHFEVSLSRASRAFHRVMTAPSSFISMNPLATD